MFSHHSDVLHYMWQAFTELGHDVYIADNELTLACKFNYSSVINNKFQVVDQLFDPGELFPDMKDCKFASISSMPSFSLVWSMLPQVMYMFANTIPTWFDAQMQSFLREPRFRDIDHSIRTANHPDAKSINNFDFVGNWVNRQPDLVDPLYITQLITEAQLVDTTQELLQLKEEGLPVRIYGGPKCPDGFIRDKYILPFTRLLVHNKKFGVNCYAVCKALDMGIPVYMEKSTKELIGFGDLPDSLFIFREEYSIEEAYELSKLRIGNKINQDTYRSIYTLDRTKTQVKELLDKRFISV